MAKNKTQDISSKWTEDWIPVRQIMNGMIQLDNGEYVTGIKVYFCTYESFFVYRRTEK